MRRVMLCGNSLCISGLQASLSAVPEIELQRVDTQPENIHEQIATLQPEVLVIEAGCLKSDFSFSLLHIFPGLKLIGVDMEENRLLVFSSFSALEPTPEELLQVIET